MQADCNQVLFLHESAGGNSLDTHYIPYQENANNLKNPRISDEGGVCSAVGLSQLGSRAGPGGAFHGHGLCFHVWFFLSKLNFKY